MKIRGLYLLLMLLVVFPAQANQLKYPVKKELVVAADIWCPVNCLPGSDQEGLAIDLLREIFVPHGYTITYKVLPWSRAIEEARDGWVDIIPGADQAEVKGFFFPQHRMFSSSTGLFARADSDLKYKGLLSLKNRRIGTIQGYTYGDELTDYFEHNKDYIEAVGGENAFDINLKKLLLGRIDVMVETPEIMTYNLAKSNHKGQVTQLGVVGLAQDIYIAFSPHSAGNQNLALLYDEGIRKLQSSGRLEKIYEKYSINFLPSRQMKKNP